MASGRLELYNIRSSRGPTTIRLEPEFWQVLEQISKREGLSINVIIQNIDATRGTFGRTGACRVFILQYCLLTATALGQDAAGHGGSSEHLTRSDRAFGSQVAGRNAASMARPDVAPDRLCQRIGTRSAAGPSSPPFHLLSPARMGSSRGPERRSGSVQAASAILGQTFDTSKSGCRLAVGKPLMIDPGRPSDGAAGA